MALFRTVAIQANRAIKRLYTDVVDKAPSLIHFLRLQLRHRAWKYLAPRSCVIAPRYG